MKKSKSELFMENRVGPPQVSALMAQGVSSYRKGVLEEEVEQGLYRQGSAGKGDGLTKNSNVVCSVGINKTAQVVSGGGYKGSGDTVKQAPEVYSPLWLNSNLSLPRDRATINAWCRSFFALNPFVQNAISLHSTYPISKLSIKCPNKDVEKFFNDMIEELDLMNICVQIAQEYWNLGEAFIYAELDQHKGKWSRLVIQNPDFMVVKRTVIANEPQIMLRPDENLKRIVTSNKPGDIEQRKQLGQYIVDSVRRGQNIELNNFNVSHLARRISPYEIRGTGLPVCVFRSIMLFDKLKESKFAQADNMINPLTLIKVGGEGNDALHPSYADLEAWRTTFECHDEETEVLTDRGFKKFHEVIDYSEEVIFENEIGQKLKARPKDEFKIACFNEQSNSIEYLNPTAAYVSNYNGEMISFKSRNYDMLVTPNHKMFVQKNKCWQKISAKELNPNHTYRFLGHANYNGTNLDFVNILNKQIPIDLYLKILGYIISEGYLGQNTVNICQNTDSLYFDDMRNSFLEFAKILNKNPSERIRKIRDLKKYNFKKIPGDTWSSNIYSKELMNYFINLIGDSSKATSYFKQIPIWIKNLNKDKLSILLHALVQGDGSFIKNKNSNAYKYYTVSKKLADDVQEIVYKCGFPVSINKKILRSKNIEYCVSWSDAKDGQFPLIIAHNHESKIQKNNYNGKVWCFTVPTGLFITRRNGKIAIQGNSAQNDKDFKIFTHAGVTVEKVGSAQGIYDVANDFTQLMKEIYVGLQVPQVLMDGGSDTTYANGGVALDVLRQRYMQFRNMLSTWLRRKIFAPISKLQEFYEYVDGKEQLIVPDVDWNHMSLFDTGDYITNLISLTQSQGDEAKRASLHTLYRSMGLEYEDEVRKRRKEAIQDAIFDKEKEALKLMDLNQLRALGDDDEIKPPADKELEEGLKDSPVPGESLPTPPNAPSGLDLGGKSSPA